MSDSLLDLSTAAAAISQLQFTAINSFLEKARIFKDCEHLEIASCFGTLIVVPSGTLGVETPIVENPYYVNVGNGNKEE